MGNTLYKRPGGGMQLCKERIGTWTKTKRTAFLAVLAETANVTQAARSVGMDVSGVYQLRRRDAPFAQAWHAALCEGYENLERLMLERALAGMRGEVLQMGDGSNAAALSERTMLSLLAQHRATVRSGREAARGVSAQDQGVQARLIAKLEAMHARLVAAEASQRPVYEVEAMPDAASAMAALGDPPERDAAGLVPGAADGAGAAASGAAPSGAARDDLAAHGAAQEGFGDSVVDPPERDAAALAPAVADGAGAAPSGAARDGVAARGAAQEGAGDSVVAPSAATGSDPVRSAGRRLAASARFERGRGASLGAESGGQGR